MAFGLDDLMKKAGDMLEQAKDVVADKIEDLSEAAEQKMTEMGGSDMLAQAKAKFEDAKDYVEDKVDAAKDMVEAKVKDFTGGDEKPA